MGEWIPLTHTTPDRYVADDDLAQGAWLVNALATKHSSVRAFVAHAGELDAAIADLQVAAGYAQAATERLTRELAELRARVDALQADVWEMPPDAVSYAILEPMRDDALDDQCAAYERIPQSLDRSNTNQTYSWLPGDAWDQYCADADGDAEPSFVRVPVIGTVNWDTGAVAWTTELPFVHSPGYEANEIDARDLGY